MTPIYVLKVLDEATGELLYKGTFYTEEALEEEGIRKANHAIEQYCELEDYANAIEEQYNNNVTQL